MSGFGLFGIAVVFGNDALTCFVCGSQQILWSKVTPTIYRLHTYVVNFQFYFIWNIEEDSIKSPEL